VNGGRFNRPGVEALYLSVRPDTALAEYRQGASITPPATLVAYQLDVIEVVDFSNGYDAESWPPEWADVACDWKYIARIERRDPPTWLLGDGLIRDGIRGLLFPSFRHPGGTNIVLFSANLGPESRVEPYDPAGKLPHDQSSWRRQP